MQSLHDARNERVAIDITTDVVDDFGPEVSSLLRRASAGHLYDEHVVPLQGTNSLVAAVATRTLTWPSTGVRALEAEAVAFACIGAIRRALLVPAIATAQNRLNVGLLAATTKALLESLAQYDCDEVVVFAREGSTVVQAMLVELGFTPSTQNAVTDDASFIAYAAEPPVLLDRLGIAGLTEGDTLALRVDAPTAVRLGTFHLTLDAAAQPYLQGRPEWAEVLTGLAGWGFYPIDGGINTPSAGPTIDEQELTSPADG
jgi:hypothetical protein